MNFFFPAAELFCENLEDSEIEPYLLILLGALVHNATAARGIKARGHCIGAIGAAAQAAKSKFAFYLTLVFPVLLETLRQTSEELIPLRARATTTAACIIQATHSPNQQDPEATLYQEQLIELVLLGLEPTNHPVLRGASFKFVSCLCLTLKDDFASLVPKVIPYTLAALSNAENVGSGIDLLVNVDLLCCLFWHVSGTHMSQWLKPLVQCVENLCCSLKSDNRQVMPQLIEAILINVHHTYLPSWAPRVDIDSSSPIVATQNNGLSSSTVTATTPDSCVVMTTLENRGWLPTIPAKSLLHEHTIQLWVERLWPILYMMLKEVRECITWHNREYAHLQRQI